MQIDSHSRFIKGWDTKIKNMYKQCESKKSILTHYPPSHSQYEQILKKVKPSHTCKAHFENKFHIISGAVGKNFEDKPFITSYVSAGLLFGDAKFLHEVPFDPYLPYMFQGEEILLSARLWTNGWDLYNLSEPVITHYYNREKDNQPHFWDDHKRKRWAQIQTKTNKRYYYILQEYKKDQVDPLFLTHVDDYNVGNSRSLKDWFKFTGIDMKNKKSRRSLFKKI